jgi:hypothetical protein
MPARFRRSAIVSALAMVWIVATAAPPAAAASTFSRDVYFSAGYERQVDSRTCTAASTAMMLNFIAHRDLRLNQLSILKYAQLRDALNNATQRGSDPLGWSRAATYYSQATGHPTTYKWEAYATKASALRRAARQIALTGKPVGLLVSHGKHAMVMTGFNASANPARTSSYTLYSIWVSDPYGSAHRLYSASYNPLNKYLETDATAYYDSKWYGRYIIIAPQA